MEKIAIFGGTFNPIHNGHIRLAKLFQEKLGLDRLILMPTQKTPGKVLDEIVSAEDRFEMCRLAVESLNGFELSDFEIKCGGVSYTVNTLRYFKNLFPDAKLHFIMGSDMFLSLHRWYCFEEILSLAVILTASRWQNEYDTLQSHAESLQIYHANVQILQDEPFEISSTQIRNMVKSGQDFTCYLPERVVQYIRNKKLYL